MYLGQCGHCGESFPILSTKRTLYCGEPCRNRAALKRYQSKPEVRARRIEQSRRDRQRFKLRSQP